MKLSDILGYAISGGTIKRMSYSPRSYIRVMKDRNKQYMIKYFVGNSPKRFIPTEEDILADDWYGVVGAVHAAVSHFDAEQSDSGD